MTCEQIKDALEKHLKWLRSEDGGECANLCDANLCRADLRGADLSCANLCDANLCRADLRGADLSCANLCRADLTNIPTDIINKICPLACPSEGAFIGWKKASGYIVKLQITETAKRSSATGRKCRCSEALVLGIETPEGNESDRTSVTSDRDLRFIYTVGKTVKVDNFDENRMNECSTGIHFFITRQEAVDY